MNTTMTCRGCGNAYEASPADIKRGRKYCSVACSTYSRHGCTGPTIITCKVCGKEFRISPRHLGKRTTCGYECMGIAKRTNPDGAPKWIDRPCDQCGKVFPSNWNAKDGGKRFCSRSCAGKATSVRMAEYHVQRKDRITCVCATCGKSFTKYPSRVHTAESGKANCCSQRCATIWGLINRSGRTDIEVAMASMLGEAGIAFREQVRMHHWVPDFVIDDFRLVVFCDGTYWHSKPAVAARDKGAVAYLTKCGWNVLRFSDVEIKDASSCMARILAYRPINAS